jgi:glycosyltransferase involved in cell wall biosynthesis
VRIAVVTCSYLPTRNGIASVAARNAKALVELGYEVEVFCPAPGARESSDVVDGIRVHRLRSLLRHGESAFVPSIARRIRGFDGMILNYPFFGGAEPAALAARLSRVPYLVYFHMEVPAEGRLAPVLTVHSRLVAPYILRGARLVLVGSHDYADHTSLARLRLPSVRELPYGVDIQRFSPADVSATRRRELGLHPTRPVVLFVGTMNRIGTNKGIRELLRAMADERLRDSAQVVLAGDGDLRPAYQRLAAELLPPESVHFAGRVSDDDLVDLYRAAAVTVLPSVSRGEAFGLVLIESMACGTPVVASALPGVRGVIADGAGRIVAPGDVDRLATAIVETLRDPDAGEASRAARARAVDRYSHERERAALASAVEALSP